MCQVLRCAVCRKKPEELREYIVAAQEYRGGTTPDDYVRAEEATLDPSTGLFLCTPCYLKVGSPVNGMRGVHAIAEDPYYENN